MSDPKKDKVTGTETTGHSWDGIEELNNPLPRWWLWTLYLTIIWGIGYTIAYPAWPMISGATRGVLGFATRTDVAKNIEEHEAKNAELVTALNAADLAGLDPNSDLHRYGVSRGRSVFAAQCSQCHGAGAAGVKGYPNLLDDDWLWGGKVDDIVYTVTHGVRNETDSDARYSQMPAFGEILTEAEIDMLTDYVVSLSDSGITTDEAAPGATLFADNCASCHGEKASGDREQGAPNLADAVWLYGGDRDTVKESITSSRFGVMPAWGQRLSIEDVRSVSLYLHALGGGE